MGARGPIGNSRLRVLTDSDRRARPPRPATIAGSPSCPPGLPEAARREWRRLVRLLAAEEGLLTRLDRGVLAAYCLAWDRLLTAQRALEDGSPLAAAGSHGGTVARPEVQIVRDATAQLAMLADRLGLSPAGRARLGLERPEKPKGPAWVPEEEIAAAAADAEESTNALPGLPGRTGCN